MLGHKLAQVLGKEHDVSALCRMSAADFAGFEILPAEKVYGNIDVRDFDAVRNVIVRSESEVVINAVGVVKQSAAAAYILDTVELNTLLPQKLALTASELGIRLISISTDCVFDGAKGNYTETDIPNALDLYGQSKHWGEIAGANCLTIRTSIIGRELKTNHGLIEWFLSKNGGSVKGFTKAVFSGFPTLVLADIINRYIINDKELSGVYHISSPPINKYDLLKLVKDAFDLDIEISPSEELKIDRSLNSDSFAAITGFRSATWPEMIEKMAADKTPYNKWKRSGH